jgi:hypothetical protein
LRYRFLLQTHLQENARVTTTAQRAKRANTASIAQKKAAPVELKSGSKSAGKVSMAISPDTIERLFPKVVGWVRAMEQVALEGGQALLPEHITIASKIGVNEIDRVRILMVSEIPRPEEHELKQFVDKTGVISSATRGITFGHGIMLKVNFADLGVLAHELGHVVQYERLSGIEGFLKPYLEEVEIYPNGPMEREANQLALEAFQGFNPQP